MSHKYISYLLTVLLLSFSFIAQAQTTDTTPPTIDSITAPDRVSGTFTITIQFSENVTDFTLGDISAVGNGTASNFSGSDGDDRYNVDITPSAFAPEGVLTINMAIGSNAFMDLSMNGNAVIDAMFNIIIDRTAPRLEDINRYEPSTLVTNADTLTWEVVFSENVSNVDASDFSLDFNLVGVTGSLTVAPVMGDASRYRVTASGADLVDLGLGDDVIVDLNIDTGRNIADLAGNSLAVLRPTGSLQEYIVENEAPRLDRVSRMTPTAEVTDADTLTWLVVFNDDIKTVDASDFSLDFSPVGATGSLALAPVVGNASRYRVTASGGDLAALNATVSLSIDTGHGIIDLAGNPLTNPAPLGVVESYMLDNAPTVTIDNAPTETSGDFMVDINFNEDVMGFAMGDIALVNGMLRAGSLMGSGSSYTAIIMPNAGLLGGDMITINIAAAAAMDLAGNQNTAATEVTVDFTPVDTTPPTVMINNAPTETSGDFPVTIKFSEDVTGFAMGDIALVNGMLRAGSLMGSGSSYTAIIMPNAGLLGGDMITINIAAAAAMDLAGNQNTAATEVTVDFTPADTTPPTVMINNAPTETSGDFPVTIKFSEDVTGFAMGDIALVNGMLRAGSLMGSGSSYTAIIMPNAGLSGGDMITINIAAAAAMDLAGNQNTAATEVTVDFTPVDTTPPTVMINNAPTETSGDFPVTIKFSEDVTGFAMGDIALVNGMLRAGSLMGSGSSYTAIIMPNAGLSGGDMITINIAAAAAMDLAGNQNTAATEVTVDFTTFAVTSINRMTPPDQFTNADSLTWDVIFSEDVNNVDVGDFDLVGTTGMLTVTAVVGDASRYEVMASGGNLATLNGTVSLSIDAGHDIENTAGNALISTAPANPQSYMVDNIVPMISENTAVATPTNNTTPEYVFNSSEAGTITYGGACSSATGTATAIIGTTITFNQELMDGSFVPLPEGDYTNCTITVTDPAGNESTPALMVTPFTIDTTGPTVDTIVATTAAGSYGIGQTVAIEVTFSEPVEVTGLPVLSLNNNGGQAVYSSGSGSSTLVFSYTVSSGQGTANLDYSGTDALNLAGASINDLSGNSATPDLPPPDADGLRNNTAELISIIAPGVILVSGDSGSYRAGDIVTIHVQFSQQIMVSPDIGLPIDEILRLTLETGDVDRMARFSRLTNTNIMSDTLEFIYRVEEGDRSQDLAYTAINALVAIGGTRVTSTIGEDVILTLPELRSANSLAGSSEIVVGVLIEEQNARLNEMLLPKIAQVMSAVTVDAITRRIEEASDSRDQTASVSSSVSAILPTGLPALKDMDLSWLKSFAYDFLIAKAEQSARSGSIDLDSALGSGFDIKGMLGGFDIKHMLGNSEFAIPLNASGGDGTGSGATSNMVLWGNGDYSNLSDNDDGLDYDGDIYSINVGIDSQINQETLLGISVNWSNSDFDYRDATTAQSGDYGYQLYGINPYISWSPQGLGGGNLWATVGYGIGEIENQIEGIEKVETDTRQYQFSGGGRYILTSSADQSSQLSIKGDLTLLRIDVDRSAGFFANDVDSQSFRLLLQGSSVFDKGSYSFSPSLEGGLRYDLGDGDTGGGIELSPAFTYKSLDDHILIEGRGRYLIAGQHDQWGLSVLARIDQARHGRGLSFSMHPTWGQSQAQAQQLTAYSGSRFNDYRAAKAEAQMKTELSYGMHMSHILGQTMLLTPYAEFTLGENARYYQFGQRLSIGELLSLSFKLSHHQRRGYVDDNHLGLESAIKF